MKITYTDLRLIIHFLRDVSSIIPHFDGYRLDILNARIHSEILRGLNIKLMKWHLTHSEKHKMHVKWSIAEKASFVAVYTLVGSDALPVMELAGKLDKEII